MPLAAGSTVRHYRNKMVSMGRSPCCSKEGMKRGAWTAHEDQALSEYIRIHGQGRWRELPKKAGLKRCGKSCRLRWLNYLRPDIKRGNITHDEEELIVKLHRLLGNRWSLIAGRLPGRTDNEIKNYWNTNLSKRVEGSSTPTSSQKNSDQPRKKKYMGHSTNEAVTSQVQAVQVVRTKAYRCTKVFLNPHIAKVSSDLSMNQGTELKQQVELKSYKGLLPFSSDEEEYRSSFMMDLNMGDYGLSDLLGSDFSQQLCYFDKEARQFDDNNNSSSNDLSLSSDQTTLFHGGMLVDDWRESECIQHNETSPDLRSITCFLDSEEGWLGE